VPDVLRLAAFTDDPSGGNPAGVVLDAHGMSDAEMLALAARLDYSESAFLFPRADEPRSYDVRYFSPLAEVPFCGHATIASAVAVARRNGPGGLVLYTQAGQVAVRTRVVDATLVATLTSVPARLEPTAEADVDRALALLGWAREDLDPGLPPRIAYAGARHLVLAAGSRGRLADLDYDVDGLKDFMLAHDLTTVALVWREAPMLFHARNPFPVGGVFEDPATGAAAAALGAYLRDLGLVEPPVDLEIRQGDDMGRPSRLGVHIPAGRPEIQVTGAAVEIP